MTEPPQICSPWPKNLSDTWCGNWPIVAGLESNADQERIVGGSPADAGQFPYQVSLRHFGLGQHICGGTIISNEWILTAAHCITGLASPSDLKVVVGSNKLSSGGTTYAVTEVRVHSDYNPSIFKNDVAVLMVEPPIVYSDTVGPIVLERGVVEGQQPAVAVGWGMHSFPGPVSDELYYLNSRTTTTVYCALTIGNVDGSQVCAYTRVGEGFCRYDSGGPLLLTSGGVHRQVGIASWGALCARGYPDVYTRVPYFYNWINAACNGCL